MTKAVAPKAGTAVPVVNRGLPAVNLQMLNRVAIKRRGGRKERGKEGREGGRTDVLPGLPPGPCGGAASAWWVASGLGAPVLLDSGIAAPLLEDDDVEGV
jgi:hypothetical protein